MYLSERRARPVLIGAVQGKSTPLAMEWPATREAIQVCVEAPSPLLRKKILRQTMDLALNMKNGTHLQN